MLYPKKSLKNCINTKYYTGNSKIIIEFQGKNEDKSLLIAPFDVDEIKKNNIFIILYKDKDKRLLFYKIWLIWKLLMKYLKM